MSPVLRVCLREYGTYNSILEPLVGRTDFSSQIENLHNFVPGDVNQVKRRIQFVLCFIEPLENPKSQSWAAYMLVQPRT